MRLAGVVTFALVACTPRVAPELAGEQPHHATPPPFVVHRPTPFSSELRLPRPLVPTSYRARLSLNGDRIDGLLAITGDLAAPEDTLWVHADDLVIHTARAVSASAAVPLEPRVAIGDRRVALLADRPLPAGHWTLELVYTARIANHGAIDSKDWWGAKPVDGVFRQQVDGRSYVGTMFEPLAARRAFPCIDEPDLKVPWQLTLDVDAKDLAASNTAIVRETSLPDGRKRVEFAPTQPLPSYLIAFAVGLFEVVEAPHAKSGVPVRILTLAGQASRASWVRAHTTELLDAAEAWTGIPYPYGKLDIVSIPLTSRHWIAMEHPGLITANAAILDAAKDDATGAWWRGTMAHEIAHQWFGNLVTLAWWDDVWLNEGFAVWLGDKLEAQFASQPALEAHAMRLHYAARTSVNDDALRIRAPIEHTQRAKDIVRYMAGGRAAQLIAMLEAFLGPEAFQRAIRQYLTARAHSTASSAELIAAITPDGTLGRAVATYLDNEAAPVVAVERVCSRTSVARIRLNGAWSVPLCLAYDRKGARAERCLVVDKPITDVELDACPSWLHPNGRGAGYYTTIWAQSDLDALLVQGWQHLTPAERFAAIASADRTAPTFAARTALQLYDRADPDPELRAWVAHTLGAHVHQVPDDLRVAFAAKLGKRLTPSVRAVSTLPTSSLERIALAAEAELVAIGDDPTASKHLLTWPSDPLFASARNVIAGRLDPMVAPTLLAEFVARTPNAPFALNALSYHPSIVALVDAAKISEPVFYWHLFSKQCASSARAAIHVVVDAHVAERDRRQVHGWIDRTIDACIAERTKLEPVFRAWLTPSSRSRRAN